MPPPIVLSKTKLMSFLQCPRKLWLEQYSPELEDEDEIDFAAIETGRVVGDLARQVYGGEDAHRISNERGLRAAVSETAERMAADSTETLFEATFDHDGVTVQVDVLERGGGAPRIVEVKSATAVKAHYLNDCAIQAWTMTEAGYPPSRVSLAHIDNGFVYRGDGDYGTLFAEADLTADVMALVPDVARLVRDARATLAELDEPERPIGEHCRTPYVCPFFEHCAPPQGVYPVLGLGGRKKPLYELMLEGYADLRDVPEARLGNDRQRRIRQQTIAQTPYVDPRLRERLADLGRPRYYLDFETIAFAIPIWPDTRPYEALPFQWSCHVERADGTVAHDEFIDLSGDPPMRRCADALVAALGTEGPILVYTGYEQRVLRELGARYRDLEPALAALVERLVDLHPLIVENYYHPDMHGSWSIKAVLPTVAPDLDYGSLDEVRDGDAAQTAYLEAIAADTPPERRERLRAALAAYCRFDTLAMIRLTEFFAAA